jgi:AIG1 family
MTEKRVILLLGRTGNGKSTVANVISNTNKFRESELGTSETRGIQEGRFKVRSEDIEYHIVDTIGIGDTRFDERQVLVKLAEATNAIRNGLNQIFFVTSGRFTEEEVKAYNLLRTVFFAEDIGKYTTIVRTKFPTFRRAERCAADKEAMIRENEDISDIIQSCNKLIHVNNMTEDEDPELRTRAECRNILRHHLKFNCAEIYRPRNLDEANERIRNHMTDREKTQKEMNDLNDRLRQSEERAKNADAEARRREERIQQDCNNRLNNLVSQQANREDKIAKLMADQMNSKLSEIKEGYGTVISSLQSTIGSLNERLDSERTNFRNNYKSDLDEALKAQAKLYDAQHTKQANIYKSQIEDLNKRKPEVHHHHHNHSLCKIM